MIQAGDVIENPVTGERLVFRKTSRETNGEAVELETFVKPDGFVAAAHVHPHQEEQFHVLRGTVGFRLGREEIFAGPGQRVTLGAPVGRVLGYQATYVPVGVDSAQPVTESV